MFSPDQLGLRASQRSRPAHEDGRPSARGHSDDEAGEAEFAKSASHLALLAFNR